MTDYYKISEELRNFLTRTVKDKYRLEHIYGVTEYGSKLAGIFNINRYKVITACLAHDLFRDSGNFRLISMAKAYNLKLTFEEEKHPVLLHSRVAAEFIRRKYNPDENIINAVAFHTSGSLILDEIGKIVVISDSAESSRNYPEVHELRELSEKDLDEAFYLVIKNKIKYALLEDLFILEETINTWNHLVQYKK